MFAVVEKNRYFLRSYLPLTLCLIVAVIFATCDTPAVSFNFLRNIYTTNGGVGTSSDEGAVRVVLDKSFCTTCADYAEVHLDGEVKYLDVHNKVALFDDVDPGRHDIFVRVIRYRTTHVPVVNYSSIHYTTDFNGSAWVTSSPAYYSSAIDTYQQTQTKTIDVQVGKTTNMTLVL